MSETNDFHTNPNDFKKISLKDGEIWLLETFLSETYAKLLFNELYLLTPWRTEEICIYGKKYPLHRETAWFGSGEFDYRKSQTFKNPLPWTESLFKVKTAIESLLQTTEFNSVLLNRYNNGNDHISWHSDDKVGLQTNSIIASVSLGAVRRFDIKHKTHKTLKEQFQLSSGSLIIMRDAFQKNWLHRIPPQKNINEARINLTFRNVLSK